ncbi:MAG: hypothetical protein EDR02_01925 [Actinobacteria bacterium]|nr:MAG: hypothetical protein EDR02_01925 [Actinomycetota bacterium]
MAHPDTEELGEKQVEDLLFGDTDPRQLVLFLAQKGETMSSQARDQRRTILDALNAHAGKRMAVETAELASQTSRLAFWTTVMATATLALAVITAVANIVNVL